MRPACLPIWGTCSRFYHSCEGRSDFFTTRLRDVQPSLLLAIHHFSGGSRGADGELDAVRVGGVRDAPCVPADWTCSLLYHLSEGRDVFFTILRDVQSFLLPVHVIQKVLDAFPMQFTTVKQLQRARLGA